MLRISAYDTQFKPGLQEKFLLRVCMNRTVQCSCSAKAAGGVQRRLLADSAKAAEYQEQRNGGLCTYLPEKELF
jgi:hypothetical protein